MPILSLAGIMSMIPFLLVLDTSVDGHFMLETKFMGRRLVKYLHMMVFVPHNWVSCATV